MIKPGDLVMNDAVVSRILTRHVGPLSSGNAVSGRMRQHELGLVIAVKVITNNVEVVVDEILIMALASQRMGWTMPAGLVRA